MFQAYDNELNMKGHNLRSHIIINKDLLQTIREHKERGGVRG
jgi:hypothetical protein